MNWRSAVGALVAVLLPMPLVLLLASALRLGIPEQEVVNGRRVSPVLSPEERQSLQTYHRDCGVTSECDPPLGCLLDLRAGAQYCTDSQCLTEVQCRDGQVCRLLATYEGPLVRMCVPLGIRKEGERCFEISEDLGGACEPGLICGGEDSWCGRPCRKDDASSCPEGFFCVDTEVEPMCMPTCEQRGCPDGQHCIRYAHGSSACAKVYGTNCQQTPCPGNQECGVEYRVILPGTVWMQCEPRCDNDSSTCPPGLVCDSLRCLRPCLPDNPSTCPEGYRCEKYRPHRPWVCKPDMPP